MRKIGEEMYDCYLVIGVKIMGCWFMIVDINIIVGKIFKRLVIKFVFEKVILGVYIVFLEGN